MIHNESSLPFDVLLRYPRQWFIETGTNIGSGVAVAQRLPYRGIWSAENDPKLHDIIANRFSEDERVHIWNGDSVEMLSYLMPVISDCSIGVTQSAVVFLDAHSETENPLLRELWVLAIQGFRDHVLMIDDARMFGAPHPSWCNLTKEVVEAAVLRVNPEYKIRYVDNGNAPGDLLVAAVNHEYFP